MCLMSLRAMSALLNAVDTQPVSACVLKLLLPSVCSREYKYPDMIAFLRKRMNRSRAEEFQEALYQVRGVSLVCLSHFHLAFRASLCIPKSPFRCLPPSPSFLDGPFDLLSALLIHVVAEARVSPARARRGACRSQATHVECK